MPNLYAKLKQYKRWLFGRLLQYNIGLPSEASSQTSI